MYSALKRDGQPLYKLARAGEVVEREPRSVTIARLELLAFEGDTARLAVDCSKGTYIRTLVEDIGEQLGCGAYVAELRRTQAGPFTLAQTVTLEELEAVHAEGGNEAVDRFLMPSDSGLLDWPLLQFSEAQRVLLAQRPAGTRPGCTEVRHGTGTGSQWSLHRYR